MTYITPHKVFGYLDRLHGWSRGEKPAPVTLEVDLSNRCYLKCDGCHFAYTHVRGPWASAERVLPMAHDKGGDLADVAVTKRWLKEAADFGVRGVTWTGGGEPTTHPQWVEIVGYADSVGLAQGMYTAGGLLTPETARFLRDRATYVVISLDCHTAESYAKDKGVPPARFDDALLGLSYLVGGKATIGVSFLLHAGNWREADLMLSLARTHGATYTTFRPMIHTVPSDQSKPVDARQWITEALPTLRSLAEEPDVELDVDRYLAYRDWTNHGYATCHGIKLSATITPDARVWVCPNRREFAGSCLGDLKTESFAQVWAKHPAVWTDFSDCRVMCRLHQVNQVLSSVYAPRHHEVFV